MSRHALRLGEDPYWNTHTVLNACPQKSKLSRGIWLDLGEKEADWADDFGSLWVITGPVIYHNKPLKWLGEEGEVPVAIPHAFFRIVVRQRNGLPHVLAFIYPQEGIAYKRRSAYDHTPYLTSVDIIEALTGLDFFPDVPDHIETEIEQVIQTRLWD
jgi:endonuclease G